MPVPFQKKVSKSLGGSGPPPQSINAPSTPVSLALIDERFRSAEAGTTALLAETFVIWICKLAGVTVEDVEAVVAGIVWTCATAETWQALKAKAAEARICVARMRELLLIGLWTGPFIGHATHG